MTLFVTTETGEGLQTLFQITFRDVVVTLLNQTGEEGADSPLETINFSYRQITMESDAFDAEQLLTYNANTNRATLSDSVTTI